MLLTQKIRLNSNKIQEEFFVKSCGVARFAYNWALAEWQKQYQKGNTISESALRKQLNSIKNEQFPWMLEVSKTVPQQAIKNLGLAFSNFFRRVKNGEEPGYPKFKKKGKSNDSFKPDNGSDKNKNALNIIDKKVFIPRLGWVRMSEMLRFDGKILGSTISRVADKWFISVSIETNQLMHKRQNHAKCGIDMGVEKLATLDNGKIYHGAKALPKLLKKLKRLSHQHSKKEKGSQNKRKSAMKIARLHYKITCQRHDTIHKATTEIVLNNSVIAIEDLDVKAMLHKNKYSKHIADSSFYEFRRQLEYKSKIYNSDLLYVDRFFPSTKLCMDCGKVYLMPLSQRLFKCECNNLSIDRDVHAAQNIIRQALSDFKPLEIEALAHNNE